MSRLADQARQLKRDAASRWPALILMTDAERLPDPIPAAAALPRGSAVILRHYDAPERVALACALAALARARGLRLLVGADPALARRVGAHGVHLPEWATATVPTARWQHGWLITAAAHSAPALARAARCGADAVLVSPVFRTMSHAAVPPLGIGRFRALVEASPIPVYALGGITGGNARSLAGSGAAGIAGIGALSPRSRT